MHLPDLPPPEVAPQPCPAARWVIDTNVWFDLLLFADPRCHGLAHAIALGQCRPLASAACIAEFCAVLERPQWDALWSRRTGSALDRSALAHRMADIAEQIGRASCRERVSSPV